MFFFVCFTVWITVTLCASNPPTPAAETVYRDPRELCEAETFKPLCTDTEVVVVIEARYGRMQLGRCVRTDYGYVGCYSDVLEHLDGMCSGRRSCELRIPDQTLDTTTGCPREFKTYLNVSYECTAVESQPCQLCSRQGAAKLTAPSGFIGSIVTAETQTTSSCGSSKCPWLIEVLSGQTVNVTLYDFAMEQRSTSGLVGPSPFISPESCFRYAVIKETPNHKAVPVCGGKGRTQVIYSSITNTVEINIVSPEVFSQKGQFVLYYEAVGCPDFENQLPTKAELKRFGDIAVVTCEDKSHSWQRKCIGTQWIGEIGTCPGSLGPSTQPASNTLPLGVLIAIVLGIALVIGVLIVTIGVVCLKRQRSDYARPYQPTYYVHGGPSGQCYELREALQREQLLSVDSQFAGIQQQPKFCGTLPPPKPPRPGAQSSGSSRVGLGGRENVYGAPRMDQRPLPSLPNIPEATAAVVETGAGGLIDACGCHHPAGFRQQLSQPGLPSAAHSSSRPVDQSVCPQSAPVISSSNIPFLPCSVAQHYTVLDPNEVQQLLHTASGAGQLSSGSDPLAYGSSFQYLSSDDVTSCGSPTSAVPSQDIAPTGTAAAASFSATSTNLPTSSGASCHEIPLRPTRECSQPRLDTTNTTGSGSSGNSSWP